MSVLLHVQQQTVSVLEEVAELAKLRRRRWDHEPQDKVRSVVTVQSEP
jgi:hypothetical protein